MVEVVLVGGGVGVLEEGSPWVGGGTGLGSGAVAGWGVGGGPGGAGVAMAAPGWHRPRRLRPATYSDDDDGDDSEFWGISIQHTCVVHTCVMQTLAQ